MKAETIKVVIFNSALLDNERFSETGDWIIDWLFLQCGRKYFNAGVLKGNSQAIQSDVIDYVTKNFPPSYISDGNTGTFYEQAENLHQRMSELGVYNILNLYSKDEVTLGHGFETQDSEWAEDNMKNQLDFLSEVLESVN